MDLFYILFFSLFVCAFGALLLFLVSLLGPKIKASAKKASAYECGVEGIDQKNTQMPVHFYLTAILFILFDIEIIFLYPWAIAFNDFLAEGEALYILISMGIFLLLFIIGLIWEIKTKALDWE